MGKTLFQYFEEKFVENLPKSKSMREAFDKARDQAGFDGYSNFNSFAAVRKRNKKPRR